MAIELLGYGGTVYRNPCYECTTTVCGGHPPPPDPLASRIAEAIAAERERCAKIAEEMRPERLRETGEWRGGYDTAADEIAAAIRDGQK